MELQILKPRKALNKAFLKVKPIRTEIESFKANLSQLLDRTNDTESEEFHKNLVIDFLKKTYYDPNHFINTKGRNDLVIHNGNNAANTVGVIIEAKKPTNKSEMLSKGNINVKAFQELVLYYLRERIKQKNFEVKYLIATNIYEWFIFDATLFDRIFAQNKNFVIKFNDFEEGRLADTKTDFFYKQIAEPFISVIKQDVEFTHFDIRDYEKLLKNNDKKDDNKLIALFKLLSPEHLLKLPFINDSNSLDKRFYIELLYIIGLTETKVGSKKLIERNKENNRNTGSILEDAIIQLDSLDKISRLDNPSQFGNTTQEQLFNVALELTITWINRILFLKLLEAQLITYHKGDKSYLFLNLDKIKNYDDLNSLFFQVLAKKYDERNTDVKEIFEKVPYLNSSLFEPTEMEQITLFISNLKDDKTIPIFSQTVMKDQQGKKRTGNISTLQYLFEFLDAYDFGAEGGEEIQEDNKTLINASVLGLIFEKINGYKDGSFFTPGFITMYMCRETIRKAVIQKFNSINHDLPDLKINKIEKYESINDIYEAIGRKEFSRKQANEIINSLKICDPAVGSGHFLVSALNEIIAIKNDLKILADKNGKSLNRYEIEVINDELIVTDEDGELFEYNPTNKESQRIQETLFHEKQTIIENCLFGVDINKNSVKICRLRLWIELLKNAYYIQNNTQLGHSMSLTELQTLPNIDINIKCGNSLVSRYKIQDDVFESIPNFIKKLNDYKFWVDEYKKTTNKQLKFQILKNIQTFKDFFKHRNPRVVELEKQLTHKTAKYLNYFKSNQIFNHTTDTENLNKKRLKEEAEIKKLTSDLEEIKRNRIYETAFEWRFEFPEVLNDDGDFVGFDVVIGNPPYIQLQSMKDVSEQLKQFEYKTFEKTGDIYSLFYEKGNQILKSNGFLGYITSNKWLRSGYGKSIRNYLLENTQPQLLVDLGSGVFDEATVDSNLLLFKKCTNNKAFDALDISKEINVKDLHLFSNKILQILPNRDESWTISSSLEQSIKQKIEAKGKPLKDWDILFYRGITSGYNEAFIIDGNKKEELIAIDPKSAEVIKPILRGRDIKRYKAEFGDLWIINIPKGFTINGKNRDNLNSNIVNEPIPRYGYYEIDEAWIWFEQKLPAIASYLKPYKEKAKKRLDMGDYWWELRACAYLSEFEKEKIVFSKASKEKSFAIDFNSRFLQNTSYFISGKSLKYLIAILNSNIFNYSFLRFYQSGGVDGEITLQAIEQIPIPVISKKQQQAFIDLVEQILTKKELGEDTTSLENLIDQLIYQLYNLTEEEIKIVENK